MTIVGWLQIALFIVIVGLMVRPLGGYLARVYAGERTFLQPIVANGIGRLNGGFDLAALEEMELCLAVVRPDAGQVIGLQFQAHRPGKELPLG